MAVFCSILATWTARSVRLGVLGSCVSGSDIVCSCIFPGEQGINQRMIASSTVFGIA